VLGLRVEGNLHDIAGAEAEHQLRLLGIPLPGAAVGCGGLGFSV